MSEENIKGRQMRFTEEELKLIRRTFKNNEPLLKVLRKVFLPEIDPDAPLGQIIDLWLAVPFEQMTRDEREVAILSRNALIRHVEAQLLQLQALSEMPDEMTLQEWLERKKKDSPK